MARAFSVSLVELIAARWMRATATVLRVAPWRVGRCGFRQHLLVASLVCSLRISKFFKTVQQPTERQQRKCCERSAAGPAFASAAADAACVAGAAALSLM